MPLWDDYQEGLDSNFADFANIAGRAAAASPPRVSCHEFAKKFDWAHLDIAGVAWNEGKEKGATGRPVPLLTTWLLAQESPALRRGRCANRTRHAAMTSIDFYTHVRRSARRRGAACREGVGAARQRARADPRAEATAALDARLWRLPPTGFLPHCRLASPLAAETPIVVDHALEHEGPAAVLINLHPSPPPFFSRFERLVEIVGVGDGDAAAGRERWRFYKRARLCAALAQSRAARVGAGNRARTARAGRHADAQESAARRGRRPASDFPVLTDAVAGADADLPGTSTPDARAAANAYAYAPPSAPSPDVSGELAANDVPMLTEIVEDFEPISIIGEPDDPDAAAQWPDFDDGSTESADSPPIPDALSSDAARKDVDAVAAADVAATAPPATPSLNSDLDAARWDTLAEDVRMQVLQRIDIFTDTGLQEQLKARLQPIVDRASADLVATINQQVGQLLRAYVAEAIEREIDKWRHDGGA